METGLESYALPEKVGDLWSSDLLTSDGKAMLSSPATVLCYSATVNDQSRETHDPSQEVPGGGHQPQQPQQGEADSHAPSQAYKHTLLCSDSHCFLLKRGGTDLCFKRKAPGEKPSFTLQGIRFLSANKAPQLPQRGSSEMSAFGKRRPRDQGKLCVSAPCSQASHSRRPGTRRGTR